MTQRSDTPPLFLCPRRWRVLWRRHQWEEMGWGVCRCKSCGVWV